MIKLWKDSRKDTNGWAYESEIGKNLMLAMNSLAFEMRGRNEEYEKFFNETTNQIMDLLNAKPPRKTTR